MTLINLDEKELSAEGRGEHWAVFKAYKGTPVHQAIRTAIEDAIPASEDGSIFSAQMGSAVLGRVNIQSLPGGENLSYEATGSLFGMVLWNHLALHQDTWVLGGRFEDIRGNDQNITYFRKIKST